MVLLVTVRSLAEATQGRRQEAGQGEDIHGRRLVQVLVRAPLHTSPPPGEGAATAAVWSQHGGVLTTHYRCLDLGDTEIFNFIHGVRFSL